MENLLKVDVPAIQRSLAALEFKMPTATARLIKKQEPPVRFVGFSGNLMIFSDSRLIPPVKKPTDTTKPTFKKEAR